ncbi:MAG: sigma-54-dependent Fis family transcriptional regulator [Calditrichaeota bacterium]|nr:MAG: sigma-54-dependent Fis family transcriptional regulator [Calditrichota bacterium]MBL1207941.1 sigma-54-dependent Fis family transcriptional regulator [Calditrichota bacterium]NOG47777.1 sigma-54-dependent Fis family transcriptional regulator [Calditrichota bacterium]
MKSKKIIIVEDNETMRLGMSETLRREGYEISDFADAQEALSHFKNNPTPLIISDLRMDKMDGMELLQKIKDEDTRPEFIIVSAYGTVETAVKAMHLGAADFMTKPFSNEELRIRVRKIFEKLAARNEFEKLQEQNLYLNEELSRAYPEIIGQSPVMQDLFEMVEKVAAGESTIIIEGESGTGKELVARAIHRRSKRCDKPFVRVNCGALNDNLLESELFGHEKGAFTGAIRQRKGRFELAEGGTLFLDEIGDISLTMQVKLLRVLQEKEFERVGGEETIQTDVRIISATNKNLHEAASQNNFREDLYYRLSVIPIKLPALRERKEDIALLTRFFIDKINSDTDRSFSPAAIEAMMAYSWPGNIRELENLVERLLVISNEKEISMQTIARYLGNNISNSENYDGIPLDDALFKFEKNLIQHAMKKSDGIKNRAAKLLGIGTSSLYYKLEKYKLL